MKKCTWVVCSVDCRNTMKFELQTGKRIGQVLFIVEGEATEPNLIYRVFSGIFGYQMDRLFRNGTYRVFHRTDDLHSKITVINTEESNIRFIDKDNDFLNRMFEILIEDYQLDIDNAAIYYLFDRDPTSNTDKQFIQEMLSKLASARDTNADMTRQGLLLLSYPSIESFVGMNLLSNSIQYCWTRQVENGSALKRALNHDQLLANKIDGNTILHCAAELFDSLEMIGIDTASDSFMDSLDDFSISNSRIFEWEELVYEKKRQYGLLSLLVIALLDLGLIKLELQERQIY